MENELKVKQLAQVELTTASATSLLAPPKRTRYIVSSIALTNYAASSCKMRLHHDRDGTTWDNTTIVYYRDSTTSDLLTFPDGLGFVIDNPGTLAARCNIANTVTVTVYGLEIQHSA